MLKLKSIWADPVWSKVIATALIAVAAGVGTYALHLWPAIGSRLGTALGFALSTATLPVWLVGLLVIITSFTLLAVLALAWSAMRERDHVPQWKSYSTDVFEGLQWCWRLQDDGSVQSLFSCCPTCQYQVQAEERGGFTGFHDTSFRCDVCKIEIARFSEGVHSLQSRVVRLIQQKLRTGTWPGATPSS